MVIMETYDMHAHALIWYENVLNEKKGYNNINWDVSSPKTWN